MSGNYTFGRGDRADAPMGAQIDRGMQSVQQCSLPPSAQLQHDTSEVEREMNRLAASTSCLHALLDTLSMRLVPITLPVPSAAVPVPSAAEGACSEPRACSPLGCSIQDQRAGVEEAARRVQSLIASLAV